LLVECDFAGVIGASTETEGQAMAEINNQISGDVYFSTVIQGGDNLTIQLPRQTPEALHGLPPVSPVFTGRDVALAFLLAQLSPSPPGGPVSVVTAVSGLAGVGKTELSLQGARIAQSRGWFSGGALFVDLFGYDSERRLSPAEVLEQFLRALGVPGEQIPPGPQERNRLYTSILAFHARAGRRLLVVLDNASSHEQVRPLLPTDEMTRTIVTSRHTLALLHARQLDLDVLESQASVDLVDQAVRVARADDHRVAADPESAVAVAMSCAGLPLALRIVAALLIDRPSLRLREMAVDLSDEKSRLETMQYDDAAVQAAFQLSYRSLSDGQARLFRLMSLNPGPDLSAEAALVLADLDPRAGRRELEGLARAHLVDRRPASRWRMHDLVRLFSAGLAQPDPERHAAQERLYGWYAQSVNAADTVMRPGRVRPALTTAANGRPVAFPSRNEAFAWCEVEEANLVAAVQEGASAGFGHLVWSIPLSMWGFLTQTQSWDRWMEAHRVAAAAAGESGAGSGQAWLLNNSATGYRILGRRADSEAAFADGLRLRRELGDLHGQADSLKDMAVAARLWHDYDEALRLSHETLEILARLPEPDRSGTASTLDTIGVCLANLGRLDEAAEATSRALAIWADLDGHRDDRAWARCMMIMADIARRRRDDDQAIASYVESLEVFERIRDEWDEADAARKLGAIFAETGRPNDARSHWKRARDRFRKLGDWNAVQELDLALDSQGPET
jgi:tetratricopeptide (TPR) repeat protein